MHLFSDVQALDELALYIFIFVILIFCEQLALGLVLSQGRWAAWCLPHHYRRYHHQLPPPSPLPCFSPIFSLPPLLLVEEAFLCPPSSSPSSHLPLLPPFPFPFPCSHTPTAPLASPFSFPLPGWRSHSSRLLRVFLLIIMVVFPFPLTYEFVCLEPGYSIVWSGGEGGGDGSVWGGGWAGQ